MFAALELTGIQISILLVALMCFLYICYVSVCPEKSEYPGGYIRQNIQGAPPGKGYIRVPPAHQPNNAVLRTGPPPQLNANRRNQPGVDFGALRKREVKTQNKSPSDRYHWVNPKAPKNAKMVTPSDVHLHASPQMPLAVNNLQGPSIYRNQAGKNEPQIIHLRPPNGYIHPQVIEILPSKRKDPRAEKLFRTQSRPILGLDCEMVGVGTEGKKHALARVSIVDKGGRVVYDSYVRPHTQVTDYRTFVSGIEEHHLNNAPTFSKVRMEVVRLVSKAILVGHGLENDLKILRLEHPPHFIRDTAYYEPIRKLVSMTRCPPLKLLVERLLEETSFQKGAHDPCQDAYAPIRLYLKFREEWDREICELPWGP